MTLKFAVEPLESSWAEMVCLAEQHWQETEEYRHGQTFSPSFSRYLQYAQAGWFIQFTARDSGRMVGYSGMYVVPSMHTQAVIGTEDTWFLAPDYRKGRNAIEFYKFVEAEMKSRGVEEITMTAKTVNAAGRILEYLGYKLVAYQYSKILVNGADSAVTPPNVMEPKHVCTESPAPT